LVRPAVYRQKKYDGKIDADVIRTRINSLKPIMVEQATNRFTDLESIESQIKSIVEGTNVATIQIPFYLNVGRQLYKLSNKFSGQTLQNEACLVKQKWVARGLDATLIDQIADLFGIDTTGC